MRRKEIGFIEQAMNHSVKLQITSVHIALTYVRIIYDKLE